MVNSRTLTIAWNKRTKLRVEGIKLQVKGAKLQVEGNRFGTESGKLWAEGIKLCAEGNKLCAEGDIIFLSAVIKKYGNIPLVWTKWNEEHNSYGCCLSNGEVYGFGK